MFFQTSFFCFRRRAERQRNQSFVGVLVHITHVKRFEIQSFIVTCVRLLLTASTKTTSDIDNTFDGMTFENQLKVSVRKGDLQGVYQAIELGADPWADQNSAMFEAAEYGQLHVFSALYNLNLSEMPAENGYPWWGHASEDDFAFVAAVELGHVHIIEFMIDEMGIDPFDFETADGVSLICHAAENGQIEVFNLFIEMGLDPLSIFEEDGSGYYHVCELGHWKILDRLHDIGIDEAEHVKPFYLSTLKLGVFIQRHVQKIEASKRIVLFGISHGIMVDVLELV